MSNPFDDEKAQFYVLVNEEAQHSLWPVFAAIPGGWTVAHGPALRQSCLDYVEAHWTDMRPASLVQAMAVDPE
ncbi:MbtH family protein [Nocardia heshunensis]